MKMKWRIKVTLNRIEDDNTWDEVAAKVAQGAAAGTVIRMMLAECLALRDFKTLVMGASGTHEEPVGDPQVTQAEPVRSPPDEDTMNLMADF